MQDRETPQLVVIGSSAGGIEALSTLVATLPASFPTPIVIAQHLHPRHASHLAEILTPRSALPVVTVKAREPLRPGVVFVVPANRDVEITDHEVRVRAESAGGPKPSVDRLLSSAASVFGEQLIAVILTGSGSDGAAGARHVKEAGGTVLIQNPETAAYPAMPLSLAPTTVDIVANLEDIGGILSNLLAGDGRTGTPADDKLLQGFLEGLRERNGIDFTGYKMPTITRRLQRRMLATGMGTLDGYIHFLQENPEEYQRLVSSFLIKVTEFFRDPELFTYLRNSVLPELIRVARTRGDELRLWSAGCATGEEAYSLAILLCETLGDEMERFNVRIFATDLDAEAIEFARRGIYPASALTSFPPELVTSYFNEADGEYEVKKRIRSLVIFGQHDLGQRAPFPRIDLALCRNVLIYFTTELQKRALQLFAFSLREGGFLVVGKAETTSPISQFFTLEQLQLKVYRRQGDRVLIPPARIRESVPVASARLLPARRSAELELARARRESQRTRTSREKAEGLLLDLPVGVVCVDRRYDIQTINTAARRFLGIHFTALGEDLIHLAQNVPAAALRTAIDSTFRTGSPSSASEVAAPEQGTGELRYLELVCHPQGRAEEGDEIENVIVVMYDVTAAVEARHEQEEALRHQQAEADRLGALMQRLDEANRRFIAANQDLARSNLELVSANEEFLVANEEAQAAAEEVETLNEELQATNEELETLNEELQSTVEELNTTNDDLQARTMELQDLAVSLEEQHRLSDGERARLEAMLSSLGDAVVVVDRDGRPVLTNAAYDALFGDDGQAAPADENGELLPPEATPWARAAQGESFTMEFTLADTDGTRRWFEAKARPIRRDGAHEAGVIAIRDLSERSLRRLQEQFVAITSHELRTPLTALQGYLQLLQRSLPSAAEDPSRRYADLALRQVQRLTGMVNELMDVVRTQTGPLRLSPAPVDLVPLVQGVMEVAGQLTQGQTLNLESDPAPLTIDGDAGRLEQVLLNLLTNAITYAPDTERIDVRLRERNDAVEIEIQDYGPGIPSADLPNLFTRFYRGTRTEQGGGGNLGLGLFIAHEIITAHGGTIGVASTEGEGTTFTIRVPSGPHPPTPSPNAGGKGA